MLVNPSMLASRSSPGDVPVPTARPSPTSPGHLEEEVHGRCLRVEEERDDSTVVSCELKGCTSTKDSYKN